MDLRKAALIAIWLFFWLASLALALSFYIVEGESISPIWIIIFGLSLYGIFYFVIFGILLLASYTLPRFMIFALGIQAGFFCVSAILWIIQICDVGSVMIGIWLMIVLKSILQFFLIIQMTYALRPTQVPQLSQPRPNLLANQRPTDPEDVEQPPPSYEEYLAQRNDMPPKYEDLEEAPPAYQETMV